MSKLRELELDIELDVLTPGTLAEVVNSILEFLLYQRNQIDLVYKTFKLFVNEWMENYDFNETEENLNNYMLNRQREKAIQTKQSISTMRELILNAFHKSNVKSLRFLFGSTKFTPKESYTIHLPKMSKRHIYEHHPLPNMHLNRLLLSLLTREELYNVFSSNLNPTNLFLELEILEALQNNTSETLEVVFPKGDCNLPKSCKDIHIHLVHKLPSSFENVVLNCCRELEVFGEELALNDNLLDDGCVGQTLIDDFMTSWWEADIIVRGFKEKLVKGRSIWSK